jgi:hypothetical protein
MPSRSLQLWRTVRTKALDEIEYAHRGVVRGRRGSKFATQQVNHAYVVLLSSQFQGFCRELHSECLDFFVQSITPRLRQEMCRVALLRNRALDRGNPNPGNIGADFNAFGVRFWDEVQKLDARNEARQEHLEMLNLWRNAVAHQDFTSPKLGGRNLRIRQVREWRNACDFLAASFDEVIGTNLVSILGAAPW